MAVAAAERQGGHQPQMRVGRRRAPARLAPQTIVPVTAADAHLESFAPPGPRRPGQHPEGVGGAAVCIDARSGVGRGSRLGRAPRFTVGAPTAAPWPRSGCPCGRCRRSSPVAPMGHTRGRMHVSRSGDRRRAGSGCQGRPQAVPRDLAVWRSTPDLGVVAPQFPPGRRLRGETSRPCREARPDGWDMSASKFAS